VYIRFLLRDCCQVTGDVGLYGTSCGLGAISIETEASFVGVSVQEDN
jgi:hypothetical protein